MIQFIWGLVISSGIGWLAYQRHSLDKSGVLGAIITGTISLTAGWAWGLLLIAFFVSSTGLSKIGEGRKAAARVAFSKGEQRDFWQVIANGGIAALIALLFVITKESSLWLLYVAALAISNADTWATEIGTLSRQAPRSILKFKPVQAGMSGAVSLIGTLGALGGAFFIALIAALFNVESDASLLTLLLVGTLAGFLGCLADSLMGATVQAMYWCADRGIFTEKTVCEDGSSAELRRGFRWINNDVVNFAAGVVGVLVATQLIMIGI